MMVQQRLVDPEKAPLNQGWRIFDGVASMPRGNIATRWAITTSQVAGNDLDSADQPDSDQVDAPVDAYAAASDSGTVFSSVMAGGPQHGLVGTKKWTEGEIRHLVGLRAQRVPYHVIAAVSFSPRQKKLAAGQPSWQDTSCERG